MARPAKIEALVQGAAAQGLSDPLEAVAEAIFEISASAFSEAVEVLWSECTRRVKIEYVCTGGALIDEACRRLSRRSDGEAPVLARALAAAREAAPGHIETTMEFGLREDGLIFGTARQRAQGGSFNELLAKALLLLGTAALSDACDSLAADGVPLRARAEMALSQAERELPALSRAARSAIPTDEAARQGRPLAIGLAELSERLLHLPHVEFCADSESTHTLTGPQAAARLLALALEADAERPHAAALSTFLSELGI